MRCFRLLITALGVALLRPVPAYAIAGEETALLTKIWIDQAAEVSTMKSVLESARTTSDNIAQVRALYNTTVYVADEFRNMDLKMVMYEGFRESEAGKDILASQENLRNAGRKDYYTWDSVNALRNSVHQIYFGTPLAPSPMSPEYWRQRMAESQVTDVLKKFTSWTDPESPDGKIEAATRKRMQFIMDRCLDPGRTTAAATYADSQCSGAMLYWLARTQDAIMQNNATGAYVLAETASKNYQENEGAKDDFRGLAVASEVPLFPLYYTVKDGAVVAEVDMRRYRRGDEYMSDFYRKQRERQRTEGYGLWGTKK